MYVEKICWIGNEKAEVYVSDGTVSLKCFSYPCKLKNGDVLYSPLKCLVISYEYDKLNNRTKMSDESGVYSYTYDNGNRLTQVKKNGAAYLSYASSCSRSKFKPVLA